MILLNILTKLAPLSEFFLNLLLLILKMPESRIEWKLHYGKRNT